MRHSVRQLSSSFLSAQRNMLLGRPLSKSICTAFCRNLIIFVLYHAVGCIAQQQDIALSSASGGLRIHTRFWKRVILLSLTCSAV